MKPVLFPEANATINKDSKTRYTTPVYRHPNRKRGTTIMIACWGLSLLERIKLLWTGRVYITQYHEYKVAAQRTQAHLNIRDPFSGNVTFNTTKRIFVEKRKADVAKESKGTGKAV